MKIDLNKLASLVSAMVDASGVRVPSAKIAEEVAASKKLDGFASLDDRERETLVIAVAIASDDLDIRPGRVGGIGRPEWYKGGAAGVEPTGAAAKVAKRLREDHKVEKARANQIANAYFEHLDEGGEPMSDGEKIKRFG